MNEKELKKYQEKLMSGAKSTMKIGVISGVGGNVVGQIGGMTSVATPVSGAVNSALGLAAVGNMAAIGMSIIPGQSKKVKKAKNEKPLDNPAAYF